MSPGQRQRHGNPSFIVMRIPGEHHVLRSDSWSGGRGDPRTARLAEQAPNPVIELLGVLTAWIDAQIRYWQGRIAARQAEYARRNWRFTNAAVSEFQNRINVLAWARNDLTNELLSSQTLGESVLALANVVYNEAGAYSDAARIAVAYAWLNRTGGRVREPSGQEISHYAPLGTRWAGLNDTGRLEFVQRFGASVRAARQRLLATNPAQTDPTSGATHWVSPLGLPGYSRQAGRYARTVGSARNRAFPVWARAGTDPEVPRMQRAGQLATDYLELTASGVPAEYFLFYRGVR